MDMQAFDATRRRAMRERQPYGSRDLGIVAMELDYGLEQEGFRFIRVKKTGDPESMLEATCVPETVSPPEVRFAVERAWLDYVAFDGEAHILDGDERQLSLKFVTWWRHPGGGYMTGRVLVDLSRKARR